MADEKEKMVGTVIQATGPGFQLEQVVAALDEEFGLHSEPTWAPVDSPEATRLGVVTCLITLKPCSEETAVREKERAEAEGNEADAAAEN